MNDKLNFFHKKLQEKEYKLTPQRKIIKIDYPEIGLATVYRTLDLFADLGIAQKINFGDGKSRYELNNEDVHHHHHLICIKCGNVEEFEDNLMETLETVISKKITLK